MKQFALGVKVERTKKSTFEAVWGLCLYSFYTDSQVDHQQENRENLKHSTLHAVLRS